MIASRDSHTKETCHEGIWETLETIRQHDADLRTARAAPVRLRTLSGAYRSLQQRSVLRQRIRSASATTSSPSCYHKCGVVQDIRQVYVQGNNGNAALGTVIGAVVGGALGNQ